MFRMIIVCLLSTQFSWGQEIEYILPKTELGVALHKIPVLVWNIDWAMENETNHSLTKEMAKNNVERIVHFPASFKYAKSDAHELLYIHCPLPSKWNIVIFTDDKDVGACAYSGSSQKWKWFENIPYLEFDIPNLEKNRWYELVLVPYSLVDAMKDYGQTEQNYYINVGPDLGIEFFKLDAFRNPMNETLNYPVGFDQR